MNSKRVKEGWLRCLIHLMILTIIVSSIPIQTWADDTSQSVSSSVPQQPKVEKTVDSTNEENKIGEITNELTNERTSNSKKFQKDDGSYEFAQYQIPVHYLENGKWEDIDNTLEEVITKDKNGNTNKVLQNKQNDFKIKISKDSTAKNLIELQKDKYGVSWNLVNTQSTTATAVDSDENKLDEEIKKNVDAQISQDKDLEKADPKVKNDTKNILIQNEERKTAKKVTSIAIYPNIYKNTDLQYILKGSDIKENIVINKKGDIKEFIFKLNTTNVVPKLQEDKTIIFYDSNDTSRAVFKMQAPFMYDKENNVSENINISLNQTNEGYVLSLIPDKDWLNSNDRKYPIIIDPSLQTSLNSTSIYDTFVAANDTQNKRLNQFVRVGKSSTIGLTRTYMKFTLPQLTSGDMITNASLNLVYSAGVSSNTQVSPINVHKVTQDFDPDNLYWSNQPSYDSRIESLSLVGDSGQDSWEQWDITSIAKQWFTSGNNYGLMLEQDNGGGYSAFYSSDMDNTYAWARPQVTFSYINNSGIESYWTYHSQDVGRAGTSYVNDYNGNLVFLRNDIDMNGNRMPVSISHVFNSNDRKAANIGYGNGWRLNLNQRLERQDIGGTQYYKYTDEDGTKHYFKDSSATEINDELNLGLTLIKETNGSLSIKDKQSTTLNFNASTNDLNTITDANGNTLSFIYGVTSISGVRNLTKVIDGAGRAVTLNYYSTFNVLQSIQDTAGRVTSYSYDTNGNLVSITDSDNKTINYRYDANNNLISATNFDGYNISYSYYGVAPYRVGGITESNADGTLGSLLTISYENNSTIFSDVKDRKNVYQFDNIGQTISIRDVDGSAQYYKYGDTTNRTKLTTESKLEKTVINLLPNHDAETTDSWSAGTDGGNGTSTFSTEAAYIGSRSFKITKSDNVSRQYYDYWSSLAKGKTYTFSAYVKTVGVSNTAGKGASISFYYKDNSGVFREINSKSINGTNDWTRLQLTFTLPNDAFDGTVVTRLNMLQESGTAYFDSVQLEEGSVVNRYNLIENGDLSGTSGIPNKWAASGTSGSDGLVKTSDSEHPVYLDKTVFQINGGYGSQKKLTQSVNVNGKTGDVYSFGTWGKAYSVPSGSFQVQVAFVNATGSQVQALDFNRGSRDWQYISDELIAKADYSRIDISYIYGNNANTAYFDGAQLYKEEFGQSYQYDSNGNVISTKSLAKQNSTFQYNGSNDLLQSTDPKGSTFKYEYDNKHNVTRGTSATGIGYNFTYDKYGNALSSRVGEGTNYIQSKADYTASGNYIKSLTDSLGNSVYYNYDETKGLLTSITDAKGSTQTNSYDQMDRFTSTSKTVNGQQISNSYSYQNDQMSQLTHNGFSYNFGYDSLGNRTTVSVGNQNLITNIYEPRTSLLTKSTYGNGQSVSLAYDNLDRVTAKSVSGDTSVGVTYDAYVQNIGWQPWVNDYNEAGTTNQGLRLEALKIQLTNPVQGMKIKYQAYVQGIGWQNWVYDGGISGTQGQNLRIEAIRIQLEGAPTGYNVRYQVHSQGLGWMDPVTDGDIAGTVGQSRRIEAIKIAVEKPRYTYKYDAAGNVAVKNDFVNNILYKYTYDISDRLVNVLESNGNELNYNYDQNNNLSSVIDKIGSSTHATNYFYDNDNRLIKTTKGSSEYSNNYDKLGRLTNTSINTGSTQYNVNYTYLPGSMASKIGVSFDGYIENSGWQGVKTDGEVSGTVGSSLKYQETKMNLTNVPTDSSNPLSQIKIKYQAHVSNIGWQAPVYGGGVAGAIGPNYGIEALKIQLEGAPEGYHVWYQAHVQNIGWMEPVTDGDIAGTTGKNLRLEALRIFIVKPGSDSKDTTRIGSISNNGNSITYTYDANGNIRTIAQSGKTITYSYNELNEVIREDNQLLNKTMVYSYDAGGNITSKKQYSFTTGALGIPTSTINYGYGDANWKDKLTSYNGKTITYDTIGNLLNDGIYNYTWEAGKQLQGISGNGKNLNFKYDDAGIRTQKTVNGVTTTYHLDGDLVTYETNGTNQIYYTYDNAGNLLGLTVNGTEYFYIKNIQDDIIGLVDKAGNQVVNYTYDTWGKLISISGSLASTVGELNPYRYRGYRYDTETGLYYLNARYYNPEWGRFINADEIVGSQGELLSANMFAYAQNNPVNMSDVSGKWPSFNDIVKRIKSGISKVVNKVIQQARVSILGAIAAAIVTHEIINFVRQPVAFATVGGGASRRISRATSKGISTRANISKITRSSSSTLKGTNKKGQVTTRGGFRKKTVQNAWDNAKPGPNGGKLCPTCGEEVKVKPFSGQKRDWDVDHTPAWTNREFSPDVTRKEVLDNYQEGTRLECPPCNRIRGNREE